MQILLPASPPAESIIDAASIAQHTDYAVLALYGTNGFTGEHEQAVKTLAQLEEVILFFDGDEAGQAATEKYAGQIAELRPGVKISRVATPQGEDPKPEGKKPKKTKK